MVLGDSLLVMNSLAEKEGLRGQVQMIYLDPPYGIRFASNWQPSTRSREVKEGKAEGMSREPEQVKAFRDTWKDGIHSYLSFWRDRLVVARELLAESGSIFVQIGDENVHVVRSLLDEVFGPGNFVSLIAVQKTTGASADLIPNTMDYLVWYARDRGRVKYRPAFLTKTSVAPVEPSTPASSLRAAREGPPTAAISMRMDALAAGSTELTISRARASGARRA